MEAITLNEEMTAESYCDRGKVRKSVAFLSALNHPTRQDLINTIAENKQINVSDLSEILKLKQTEVSQHLAVLRNLEMVVTIKIGKYVYYSINHDRLDIINAVLDEFLDDDDEY